MRFVKHIVLWMATTILIVLAWLALEMTEGFKITTTEYYGLQNGGFSYVALVFLMSVPLYPVIVGPLSWMFRRTVNTAVYCTGMIMLSAAGGYTIFRSWYDEGFVG
ncbi:hypothetical protein [Paenibacillus sp. PL2-23]|uniref:hypothetical protein n=1 Tax=Paenibacillus sp. PL2-23 TaxID=2100729 RepID=UPI0030F4FBDF